MRVVFGVCQLGEYKQAVSAAYTFLVANPDHEVMAANVEYYHSMPEVEDAWFQDLEATPYQVCAATHTHTQRALSV